MACKEGRPQVLKLLAGTMDELNCMELFTHTIASIEEQLKGISSPSPPKSLDCLMSVAYYLFFVDSAVVMSLIVRITSKFPKASLKLLSEFSKQNQHENTLVLTEISLVSIPIQWVERAPLTQIKLNHNLLISVPDAMFQIATLQRLDISHNSLDAIPSVLKWNCPKLKELNVSYNRLLSVPYEILEGQKRRDFMVRDEGGARLMPIYPVLASRVVLLLPPRPSTISLVIISIHVYALSPKSISAITPLSLR